MRPVSTTTSILWAFLAGACPMTSATAQSDGPAAWRSLPLIKGEAVDPAWKQIGYGGWSVVDGALRTDSDKRGLGLLVYTREKFGDWSNHAIRGVEIAVGDEIAIASAGQPGRIDYVQPTATAGRR